MIWIPLLMLACMTMYYRREMKAQEAVNIMLVKAILSDSIEVVEENGMTFIQIGDKKY